MLAGVGTEPSVLQKGASEEASCNPVPCIFLQKVARSRLLYEIFSQQNNDIWCGCRPTLVR